MKLKDIIKNLDKSETNKNDHRWDLHEIGRECGIHEEIWQKEDDNRLVSYWLGCHMCTDTYVGLRAYFLDDIFVCLSYQKARKCEEVFEWVSEESQLKVRNFLLSLVAEDFQFGEILNLEEDMGEGYPLSFASEILDDKVIVDGEILTVTYVDRKSYDGKIIAKKVNGTDIELGYRDVVVPWRTLQNKGE